MKAVTERIEVVSPSECLVCGGRIEMAAGMRRVACGACQAINAHEVFGQWCAQATSAVALPGTRVASGFSLEVQGTRVRSNQWLRGGDLGSRIVVGWRTRLGLIFVWGFLVMSVLVELLNELLDYLRYGPDEWAPAGGFEIFLVTFGVLVVLAYPVLRAALAASTITLVSGGVELERPRWPVPKLGGLRALAVAREHIGPVRPEDVRLLCDGGGEGESASHRITVRDATGRTRRVIDGLELAQARFVFAVLVGHLSQWSTRCGAVAPKDVAAAPQ